MRNEWWSCDGKGARGNGQGASNTQHPTPNTQLPNYPITQLPVSRRQLLFGGALAGVWWAARPSTALSDVAVKPGKGEPEGDVLVSIFLRGGADGLNIVPPWAEDEYHRARPYLRVAAPRDFKAPDSNRAVDLDGFFGFHPGLAPLAPLFHSGSLAVVHACGSGDQSRSHFEASATMERGLAAQNAGAASGWIARHLVSTQGANNSPLRAVAFSSIMPDSLRGATDATALNSLADFRLVVPDSPAWRPTAHLRESLAEMYEGGKDAVAHAGRETLAVLDSLNRLDPAHYRAANGAAYPNSYLGNGLKQVACLIKGGVGLEAACLDRGGWDMHAGMNAGNWLATELTDVGRSIAAFAQDLKSEMHRVTLVAMTEFGRRLAENYSFGTDHGRASMMLLMGGNVAGGKVYAQWPGLKEHQLEKPGDLKVTTDYRDILGEIVSRRLRNPKLAQVFPEYTPSFKGIVRA